MGRAMNSRLNSILRITCLAAGFMFGVTGVVGLVMFSMRAASLEPGRSKLENLTASEEQISALATDPRVDGSLRIAFLGDSTVHSAVKKNSLPFLLGQRLENWNPGGSPAKVYSMASPALGSISFHFLARDIIAARPDLIVWQVAFSHTNDYWLRGNTHHEFSGRLSMRDLIELSVLPIHQLDLSFDDLLAYKFLANPGMRPIWLSLIKEQSRVQRARAAFEQTLPGKGGKSPERLFTGIQGLNVLADQLVEVDGRPRYSSEWAVDRLGEGLKGINPDHILLQILVKSLVLFREAEIPVVIYLSPINIEYLRSIEMVNANLLRTSIETYRSVANDHAAEFVDLHDVLPDASFRDAQGHFHRTETFDPAARLIDSIQPAVENELDRIIEARAGTGQKTRAESEL